MGITERKQRQKEALRREILDAARETVVEEGFEALTIRRVAEAVEYAPGTLYLYFANRDAIARALCLEVYEELYKALEPASTIRKPQARLKALVEAYIKFGLTHPEMYRLALMSDPKFTDALRSEPMEGPEGAGQRAFAFLVEAVKDLRHKDRDAVAFAEAVWAAVHGAVSLKLVCHVLPVTPMDRLAASISELLIAGMGSGNKLSSKP